MRRGPNRSFARLALLVALAAGFSPGQSSAQVDRAALRPVPKVTLQAAEPAVQDQLDSQLRELQTLLSRDDLSDEQLAQVFGETGQLYLLYDLAGPAEACLLNASELAPESYRWRYLLGALYQLDGRLEAAAQQLERALELQPGDGSTQMRLAEIALRRQERDRAAELFEAAGSQPGFEAASRFGLGQLLIEEDPETAIAHFERALELQPQANIVHYHLGLAYRGLDDRANMRSQMALRGDNEVRFPDPLALELQAKATGVGALLSLGRMSMAVNALDVAEQRFRAAVELDPASSAARRSLASVLQRQGRVDQAFEEYELAIRSEPDNAGLRYFVAQQRLRQVRSKSDAAAAAEDPSGERDRRSVGLAIDHLEAALEQAPSFLPAWLELAGARELLGQAEAAAVALERALAIDPRRWDLRLYRARMLFAAEDPAGAAAELETLDRASRGGPEGGELSDDLLYQSAVLRLEMGDLDRASSTLRYLAERAEQKGVRGLASFQLGNLEAGRGATEAALEAYQNAVREVPELAEAHYNLATLFGRLGRYPDSAAANRRAYELRSDYHSARFAEAMALLLDGREGEARQRLEQALELFPNQPGFAHLLSQILVAARDDSVRDGMVGLDLAIRLHQALPSPDFAETVAMAFAEIGRFDRALEWQELLIAKLEESGDQVRLQRARRYLESYRSERTVRSPWLSGPEPR